MFQPGRDCQILDVIIGVPLSCWLSVSFVFVVKLQYLAVFRKVPFKKSCKSGDFG